MIVLYIFIQYLLAEENNIKESDNYNEDNNNISEGEKICIKM